MLFIQILLIVFFIYAIFKVIGRYRGREISWLGAVAWFLFWLAAIGVVIKPDSSAYFAKLLGVGRGADLVIYLALALLFFLMFRANIRLEKIEKNITHLTRKIALRENEKENPNQK